MSTEVSLDSIDNESFIFEFAKAFPIEWEGRQISFNDLPALDAETAQRAFNLFQCLIAESQESDQLAAYLAMAGTAPEDLDLLQRDIQELICTPKGILARRSRHKKSFWEKHKKAIYITAAVIAVVGTVTLVIVFSGGVAAQAAGAAGAAVLDSVCKSQKKEPQQEQIPSEAPPVPEEFSTLQEDELLPGLHPYLNYDSITGKSFKPSLHDFLYPQFQESLSSFITRPAPYIDPEALRAFFPTEVPLAQNDTPPAMANVEWERGLARERQQADQREWLKSRLTGQEIDGTPGGKGVDNYASSAYSGSFTNDYTSQPPFQEIPIIGNPYQSTVHYHCGIANNIASVMEGGSCLFGTLGKEFAVHPHLIHSSSVLSGLGNVLLEKLDSFSKSPFEGLLGIAGIKIHETLLENSVIGKSIAYEAENLSNIAQKIIEKGNPNLKQLHVTFSNGGHVFKEALKRLPQEYRDTIVVVTTGTTDIIEDVLACKVYNVIGEADLASLACNGFSHGIEKLKEKARVEIIPQNEIPGAGHYFMQPEYQSYINDTVKKVESLYEVY